MVLKYVILAIAGISFIGLGGLQKTGNLISSLKPSQVTSDSPVQGPQLPDVKTNSPIVEESNVKSNIISAKLPPQAVIQGDSIILPKDATAQNIITLPNNIQRSAQKAIEIATVKNFPDLTKNTSLPGAIKTTGPQLKREEPVVITNAKLTTTATSSKLQQKIVSEQDKASALFAKLYGNVQNSKFATGGK